MRPVRRPFVRGLITAAVASALALAGVSAAAAAPPPSGEPVPLTIIPLEDVIIDKVIGGPAAGQQGEIVLHVSGTNGLEQDIVIPAGATGSVSTVLKDVPADTVLTITEPQTGSGASLAVEVTGLGEVTVQWQGENRFTVTDEYTPVGAVVPPPVEPEGPGVPVDPQAPIDPEKPTSGGGVDALGLAETGSSPAAAFGALAAAATLVAAGVVLHVRGVRRGAVE